MFGRVPLWLCEDITANCYMYCYFRNILPVTDLGWVSLPMVLAWSGADLYQPHHPQQLIHSEVGTKCVGS